MIVTTPHKFFFAILSFVVFALALNCVNATPAANPLDGSGAKVKGDIALYPSGDSCSARLIVYVLNDGPNDVRLLPRQGVLHLRPARSATYVDIKQIDYIEGDGRRYTLIPGTNEVMPVRVGNGQALVIATIHIADAASVDEFTYVYQVCDDFGILNDISIGRIAISFDIGATYKEFVEGKK